MDRYGIPLDRYVDDHVIPQLKELVTEYRPAVLFADGGEWDEDEEFWHTREFLAWLYNEAPNKDEVVVNDRWAKGMPGHHGDYYSSEYQDVEGIGAGHPWEESRGMGLSYGFNRAENLEQYRTSKELVHELIDVVSRGGNLLLNVGPTADGRIPVIMQERLRDIGSWLAVNGEAIFGTRPWQSGSVRTTETGGGPAVRYTRKGTTLYAQFLEWPEGDVRIEGLAPREGLSVALLGYDGPIAWRRDGHAVVVTPPLMSPRRMPIPYAYVFKLGAALD
jgi:alpha-L-fucosidase